MLNSTVLLFDASGRIRNSALVPTSYSGGVGFVGPLLSVKVGANPVDHYHQSNPFLSDNVMAADAAAVSHYSQGGLPHAASGVIACVVNGTVDHYNHGLPYAANGALVLATAE